MSNLLDELNRGRRKFSDGTGRTATVAERWFGRGYGVKVFGPALVIECTTKPIGTLASVATVLELRGFK